MDSESYAHTYHEGIELFNAGRFWDAHERWEECWRVADEPDATFYKGIIQTAAALVHWQRGNPRGLERNWQKARLKLAVLPPIMHHADLDQLIRAMDGFVGQPHNQPPRIATNTLWL